MKILVVFTDMLRANRLSSFNSSRPAMKPNPVDLSFRSLGGEFYTNCFTPGPDTARGISAFTTGLSPYLNGCNVRLKWPRFFLDKNLDTVFDLFLNNNYKVDILSDPRERAAGIFPEHITNLDVHNDQRYDIQAFLKNISLEEKHFIFMCLPQFHWTLDAYGASKNGERQAYKDLSTALDCVFDLLDKDDFDHIFVFSDHGFKFTYEVRSQPKWMLLNDDRTNTVLIHRQKYMHEILKNNKICSLEDLYPTFKALLNGEKPSVNFLKTNGRENIVIEDHINFLPEINQNIELWSVIDSKKIYIRELTSAHTIFRQTGDIVEGSSEVYDDILEKKTSYKKYKDEYLNTFIYRSNLLKKVGSNYSALYDARKEHRPALINYFYKTLDVLKIKLIKMLGL